MTHNSVKQLQSHQYANLTLLININDTTKPKQFAFIYNCTTKAIKCNLIKLHNVNSKCSCSGCPIDRTKPSTISSSIFTNPIDPNTNITTDNNSSNNININITYIQLRVSAMSVDANNQ